MTANPECEIRPACCHPDFRNWTRSSRGRARWTLQLLADKLVERERQQLFSSLEIAVLNRGQDSGNVIDHGIADSVAF